MGYIEHLFFLNIYCEQRYTDIQYTDLNMCWNGCAKNGDGILDQVLEVCLHSDCAVVWVVAGSSASVTHSSGIQAHGSTTEPWLVLLYRGLWLYYPDICGDYKEPLYGFLFIIKYKGMSHTDFEVMWPNQPPNPVDWYRNEYMFQVYMHPDFTRANWYVKDFKNSDSWMEIVKITSS